MSINNLESVRAIEALENFRTMVTDLNSLTLDGEYDLVPSTMVTTFLEPDTAPGLVASMQRCITTGSYNLIMTMMGTEDYPCTVDFPFAFKPDKPHDCYQGWELLRYNRDVGELYRTDVSSNRIKLCFVTLLACKPV